MGNQLYDTGILRSHAVTQCQCLASLEPFDGTMDYCKFAADGIIFFASGTSMTVCNACESLICKCGRTVGQHTAQPNSMYMLLH